jgi:hypothetical protein
MKNNNTFRSVEELEPAQRYLFNSKVPVLGRSPQLTAVINQIKMPALPLLRSNIEQRRALQKHGILSCLLTGARVRIDNMHKVLAQAIEQEKQKPFFVSLYHTEDAAPHEQLQQEPLTMKQFNELCNAN